MNFETKLSISRNGRPTPWFMATTAGMSAAQLGSWLAPAFLEGALQGDHLTGSQGGLVLTAELWTISIVCIVLPNLALRLSYRQLALTGAALTILFQGLSAVVTDFRLLLVCRVLTGMGEGAMLMYTTALGAEFDKPERLYGWTNFYSLMSGAVAVALLPVAVGFFDPRGQHPLFVFRYAAFLLLVIAIPLLWSPTEQIPRPDRAQNGRNSRSAHLVLGWIGCIVSALAAGPIFTFAAELGARTGASPQDLQLLLGSSILFSLPSTLAAGFAGSRWGAFWPIVIASSIGLLSALALWGGGLTGFRIAVFAAMPCLYIINPLLMGCLAQLDPSGRAAAIGIGLFSAAFATTPVIAGMLADHVGIFVIGGFCAVAYFATIGVAAGIRSALKRSATAAPGSQADAA